jgi:hypothetical protein
MHAQSSYPMLELLLSVALLALCGCAPICGLPAQHAETVTLSEIPPPAAKAFYAKFTGATIVWAGRFGSGTNAAYSIQFTQDGKSRAAWIDTFGEVGDAYAPVISNPSR